MGRGEVRVADTIYEQLSKERKELQKFGYVPEWMTTGGYQMFKQKYQLDGATVKQTFQRIAKAAAKHAPVAVKFEHSSVNHWEKLFFNLLWKGWLGASTPVLANMGTTRGMPVSCSGQAVDDSIHGFYESAHELAVLTKNGFGTSSYLGNIRPRGSAISAGGKASGVVDVITSYVDIMRKVAQGTARRGAWAGYLPMDHGDFFEVVEHLERYPDDLNLGWVVTDDFIERLKQGDKDAGTRFKRALKVKAVTGKGYFFFVDKVNRASPEKYKELDLKVLASNLCVEITLPASEDSSFTCVLSSLNLAKYDEWEGTDAVFIATVFLDCVASEFIDQATDDEGIAKPGFEKTVEFTRNSRALGLGVMGFHTLLQQRSIPFESFEAHTLNINIFKDIKKKAEKASRFLCTISENKTKWADEGRHNSHLLAVAPTTTNALICGGVSQGIEPVVANLYNQQTSAGVLYRVNPVFLELAKERGKFDDALVADLTNTLGSVQHLDWLTDHEKMVFKTAYEIDQKAIIRMASARQRHICQAQSLNLFFSADEDEEYIAEVHAEAFLDENIKSLYYMRTQAGVSASKGECTACE